MVIQTKTQTETISNMSVHTQQDYYGPQYGTLLHSYCTCTYTEVTALLLWSISAVTMYYISATLKVLQGNSGATSKKQHHYLCVEL